jgi:hypothetical protein
MTPRDIFALCVRIVGLVSLVYLIATGVIIMGFINPGAWPVILRAILLLALSLWLIRGAPQLVRFAYPDRG